MRAVIIDSLRKEVILMETAIFSGVVIMLAVGILMNIWRFVVRAFTGIFVAVAIVMVFGYLFGGAEAITNPTAGVWSGILDTLIWDGTGERVVNAIVEMWNNAVAIHHKYW